MAEERITEVHTPTGNTHTHTTIVDDGRRGSGAGWVIALILIAALALGVWFFSGMAGSERAKDNAVAEAARDVGAAAETVGDAAKEAVDGQ